MSEISSKTVIVRSKEKKKKTPDVYQHDIDCSQHKAPLYSPAVIWSYFTGLCSIGAKSKLLSLCSCVFSPHELRLFFVLFAIDRQVVFCCRFFTASQIFRGKTLPQDTLYFTPTSVSHNGYRRTNAKTFVHFAHTVRRNNICIPISLLLFFFL